MSNTVFTICKYHKVGSPIVKAVLLCMADFASDDGSGVWCSKGAMAADLELGETSVRDAVKTLLRMGLITEVGKRAHEQGYTFEYQINIDAVWLLERTRKRTPLDKWAPPAPPEPLREPNPCATRRGPLRHTKGTPSPRETKPLITINNLTTAQTPSQIGSASTVSEAFYAALLQALRVKPTGWWAEKKGMPHVAKWLAQGLTQIQILEIAVQNARNYPEPPNGPKALDLLMVAPVQTADAAAHRMARADALQMFAEKINGPGYFPPNGISPATARELVHFGLVSKETMRQRGLVC